MRSTRILLNPLVAATLLMAGTVTADQATVYVTTEAQIKQLTTTNIDEAGQGYLELKASTAAGTSSGRRKCYFQFDLAGQSPNTNAPATFSVNWYVTSGRQRVKLWALDQAYSGFSSGLIWDSAQANNTGNDQMLTNGSFTAKAIPGSETTNTVWLESPGYFTIPAPWGQFLQDHKVVLVCRGAIKRRIGCAIKRRITMSSASSSSWKRQVGPRRRPGMPLPVSVQSEKSNRTLSEGLRHAPDPRVNPVVPLHIPAF